MGIAKTKKIEIPGMDDGDKKRAKFVQDISQEIIDQLSLKFSGGFYYAYKDGCYEEKDENYVRSITFKRLGQYATVTMANTVSEAIKFKCYVTRGVEHNYLNLKSGLLDVDTMTPHSHSPDCFSVNQMNVSYNPNAECPRFRQFLQEIFNDEPEKILAVQEYLGYVLIPDCRYEKALCAFGQGDNGKSTLFKVIQRILGKKNYSTIPIENIGSRFESRFLMDKLANFAPEVPKKKPIPESKFKEVISGDETRAEHKNGAVFSFIPYAKQFISLNHMPNFGDSGCAVRKRLLTVPFNAQFRGSDRDLKLADKLFAEASGILNFMLEGRERLLKNEDFTVSPQMLKLLDGIVGANDAGDSFLASECRLEKSCRVSKDVLYNAYRDYCKISARFKSETKTKVAFGKELIEKHGFKEIKSGSVRYWSGVELIEGCPSQGTENDIKWDKVGTDVHGSCPTVIHANTMGTESVGQEDNKLVFKCEREEK